MSSRLRSGWFMLWLRASDALLAPQFALLLRAAGWNRYALRLGLYGVFALSWLYHRCLDIASLAVTDGARE